MGVPPHAAPATRVPPSRGAGEESPGPEGATGAGRETGELSVGQRGLWLSERLAPGSGAWNVTAAVRVLHEVDAGALARALRTVVRRHPSLRTSFPVVGGHPVARIGDGADIVLLEEWEPAEGDDGWLARRLADEAFRPYDLASGPLMRPCLFREARRAPVLVLGAHHMVADLWSLGIVLRDLATSYRRELAGASDRTPETARFSYRDFVRREGESLERDGEALLAFWRRELANGPPVLELPTDRPRPPLRSHRAGLRLRRLGPELSEAVAAAGRSRPTGVFTLLLAAYAALLSRHSGQDDLTIGSPLAGRSTPRVARVVGYFVNPVVIRAATSDDPTLSELVARTHRRVRAALDHGDYPFPLLVEHLQPTRDPDRHPLFQAMFLLQKAQRKGGEGLASIGVGTSGPEIDLGGLRVEPVALPELRAQTDLTLSVTLGRDSIRAGLLYDADLFDATTAERLLDQWALLLAACVEEADRRLLEIALLSPAQRHQILIEWNDAALATPSRSSIDELVARQAERSPEVPALEAAGETVTYGELERRTEFLARRLRALGVGPETTVAVCLDRSPDLVVGLLGVLRCGGAYVPLDPAHPDRRLSGALHDSGATVLLTGGAHRARFADYAGRIVVPERRHRGSPDRLPVPPSPDLGPAGLAYVIFTSGSTGRPKGVQVTRGSLANFLFAMADLLKPKPSEVMLSVTTVSFDIAVLEIFLPLIVGGRVVLAGEETVVDGRRLAAELDRSGATMMQATPATWRLLLEAGWTNGRGLLALCGGEALPGMLAERLLERCDAVWNLYGPTETTVWSTAERMAPGEGPVRVGRPIGNNRLTVLDAAGMPTPFGVPGELAIGGEGVARAYLGRPAQSAERFRPDPHGGPGARLYRTGDVARHGADGRLRLLGRIDHQVKLRGFRIEPGEIESVLAAHAGVAACAVLARERRVGGPVLIAFVVPAGAEAPAPADLRRHLAENLPSYMVPAAFVPLASLPVTTSGKTDRRALAGLEVVLGDAASDGAPVPLSTPHEKVLGEIWAELLGAEQIAASSGFFELGGHSLVASRMLVRVEEVFGVELPIRAVFDEPTLAGLARRIERDLGEGRTGPRPVRPIPAGERLEGPLSLAQQRLWFLQRLAPQSPAYNLPGALSLTGPLVPSALALALATVIRRHAVLRSLFPEADGRPRQVIGPPAAALCIVDISGLPPGCREGEARRLAASEARRPFALEREPPLRAQVVREGARRHTLLMTLHHIACDGESLSLLLSELETSYRIGTAGGDDAAELPDLPIQYLDYAVWERNRLTGEALEREIAFWKRGLDGAPVRLDLPTDRPRPPLPSFRGAALRRGLPERLRSSLESFGRRHGATPFVAYLAGFAALLHRYTEQPDLLIGFPTAHRDRPEVEPLVGLFVNTGVLRSTLASGTSFRELLAAVRELALAAYAHRHLPFDLLVDALAVPRDADVSPLVQAMFALEQDDPLPERLGDLLVERQVRTTGTAKLDLDLTVEVGPDGATAVLEYATDLFDATTMGRLLGHFETLLAAGLAAPDRELNALPILTPAERHQARVEWNDTEASQARSGAVHRWIGERAAEAPDAVAVVAGEEVLSYGELVRRARRLAGALRTLGAGPESVVALLLGRGPELIVALLGTLETGAAYLPLDPKLPRARLALLLEDAAVAVVLTSCSLADTVPDGGWPVLRLDGGGPVPPGPLPEALLAEVAPDSLAYIIYTSGSTGQPKGVMVPHRGLSNFTRAAAGVYDLERGDRVLQFASITFDTSAEEIYPTLALGATLVLRDDESHGSVLAFLAACERWRVSVVDLPTAYWHEVVTALDGGCELPAGVRRMIIGGEAALPDRVATWLRLRRGRPVLLNTYGPTEATIVATCWRASAAPRRRAAVPVGRAIANLHGHVVDRHLLAVRLGAVGELVLGGEGVTRGYLGDPALTAERFVPDPFGPAGERLYRTGDLARYGPDGGLEIVGRRDHQVKVRGVRVEPGEVEAAVTRHPDVSAAAVVLRQVGNARCLVAYTVSEPGRAPDPAELRSFLAERVPEALVPSRFVSLDALPVTTSGKVDRHALPEPEPWAPEAPFEPPRSSVESFLCETWAEVLGLGRVGIHDNFFELGGDSILGIQVIARAAASGVRITPRHIFQHQTVAALASVAEAAGDREPEEAADGRPVPLVPIQRWFFERDLPNPHHWNQAVMLTAPADLGAGTLETALAALLERHAALRLRFFRHGTEWRQAIAAPCGRIGLPTIDLTALPEGAARTTLERASGVLQTTLDLARGPVFRAALFRLRDAARLLLVCHHLAVDAVSWRILVRDLETARRQLEAGEPVRLPGAGTPFTRWAERLAELARSAELASEIPYWEAVETLAGRMPTDHPRPVGPLRQRSAHTVTVQLDEARTRVLLYGAHEAYRTRVEELLLAAVARALADWTGRRRTVINLEAHGREDLFEGVDLSRTVGWFTALFPIALDVGDGGPGELIQGVKETLRSVPRRGIGHGLIRYMAAGLPDAVAAEPGGAEVSFNYLGRIDAGIGDGAFGLAPEGIGPSRDPRGELCHALEIDALIEGDRLSVHWTYSRDLHRRETIEALADGLLRALDELLEHCVTPAAGGYSPVDFPLARLPRAALERLPPRRVDDAYHLSPLQEGILFHSVLTPGSGQYFVQLVATLRGPLDTDAFERAWSLLSARHPALRTYFLHRGLEEPVQVVAARARAEWRFEDWRAAGPNEQRARLERFLEEDRARGFDLETPPLSRYTLVRTGDRVHELVWSVHHLLLDGWSLPIVLEEVFIAYESALRGAEPPLPERRPFRDYIGWLAGRDPDASEPFWRRRLDRFTAPTPVPDDRGRIGRRSTPSRTGEAEVALPAAETEALRAFVRRHRLTLPVVLQGAWGLLLARASGGCDAVFGATVSGRPAELAGSTGMVGMFIHTLPVRVRTEAGESVTAWLARLQEEQAERLQHEHAPLSRIQDWSSVPRDLPLFETLLVVESYPLDRAGLSELSARASLEVAAVRSIERTHYPLTVFVEPVPDLRLRAVYDLDRFDRTGVLRTLGHLLTLLRSLAAGAGTPAESVPMLSAGERHQILVEWNDTGGLGSAVASAHELILRQAARTPDATAVVGGDEWLTYGGLAQRASVLAGRLREVGEGPEAPVGLYLDRGPGLVVGMLAVHLAGGVYVPLDPDQPRARRDRVLADSGAAIILSQRRLRDRLGELPGTVVFLDEPEAESAEKAASAAPTAPSVGAEHAAYLIYTSGSTGVPKGVVVSHGAVFNFLRSMARRPGLRPLDTMLAVTTLAFDIAVLEIMLPLVLGARVTLVPHDVSIDGRRLSRELDRTRATVMQATPATWRLLLDAGWSGCRNLTLLCGGEALPADLAGELSRRGAALWNLYGPTETTIWSALEPIAPDADPISVGRPIDDTRLVVAEGGGEPAPIGAIGELRIGGAGLARGYRGRPALTADRFVPDPWGPPGGRVYRTGDLARSLPDGRFEVLGRLDHQVKVRGFRVELQEIEAELTAHPEVSEAAATAWRPGGAEAVLVAYVVAVGPTVAAGELQGFLAERLPSFMVPSRIVFLDALPRTANRKLDRRALPEPAWADRSGADSEAAAPRTATERLVAEIWSGLLGAGPVGRDSSFFDLGGHSLLAGRALARVRDAFGVEVPLAQVFERPTVIGWARAIDEARRGAARPVEPIVPVPRKGPLPASPAQEQLWFLDRYQPESAVYNIPLAMEVRGALRLDLLDAALSGLTERHEILRTTFGEVDGSLVQRIGPAVPVHCHRIDLSGVAPVGMEGAARRLAEEEATRSFDLERGPLLRPLAIRLERDRHLLVLVVHHIVADGWSMALVAREIAARYEALLDGRRGWAPPPAVQYADYAVWQRRRLEAGELEDDLAYWRGRLADAPAAVELSSDRPRPPVQSFRGARLPLALGGRRTEAVRAACRRERVTPFMVLLAAYDALLSRLTGTDDVVVGSLVANRSRVETEEVVGVFVNTQVLRTRVDGDPDFAETVRRVRETTLEAQAHQELPFEELVAALAPRRDTGRSALFQVALAFQDAPLASLRVGDLEWDPVDLTTPVARFDLGFDFMEEVAEIAGQIEYATDLFDETTILRTAGHYLELLDAWLSAPELRLGALPLLTPAQRHQALAEWNDTGTGTPTGTPVHRTFADHAARSPWAVAVVSGDEHTTYRELDLQSDCVAERLRGLGVAREERVGICLERSGAMVAALLGILKAGAAYVPLDPSYPRERLEFMIEDAGLAVLVAGDPPAFEPNGVRLVRMTASAIPAAGGDVVLGGSAGDGVLPGGLAYVIYTSGSTGRPKGVAVTHGSLANVIENQRRHLGPVGRERVLQFSSVSFDISVFEIWLALGSGGTLVLASQGTYTAVAGLASLIAGQRVTTVVLPPSVLATLKPEDHDSVDTVVVGGEACPAELVGRWTGGRRFWNGYGPTETTIWATLGRCLPDGRRPPIGRPIDGMTAYAADAAGRPLPPGVPGELVVGGRGPARGYLGRPGLTADRFVPDPFSRQGGERLYRTGDLVRWLPGGAVDFLGRVDQQVKLRGYRIEIGEIEAVLRELPGVREAVVTVNRDLPGEGRLVAYVVPGPDAPERAVLREGVRARLPEYMVPSAFVALDAVPLTPTGKVDRSALPPPDETGRPEHAPPRGAVEEILVRAWRETLGLERIGIHDNFFELGGDSILCLRVVARVAEAGVRVTARQIFEHQTVAELAVVVEGGKDREDRGPATGEAPLTPVQRWFFEQRFQAPHHWNQSSLLATVPGTSPAMLSRALDLLVRHHDALRLRFECGADGWRQRYAEPRPFRLPCCDLSRLAPTARRRSLSAAVHRLQASLDLERGPLVRACFFDFGEGEEGRLHLVVHHLAIDAVSWRILFADLASAWRQLRDGGTPRLPPRTSSFRSWARALAAEAESAEERGELELWRAEGELLPADGAMPDGGPEGAAEVSRGALSLEETEALLRVLPAAYEVPVRDLLLAALARALDAGEEKGRRLIHVEEHGREPLDGRIDLSRTVGWCTALHPLVLEPPEREPRAGVAAVTRALARVPRQGLGFGIARYLVPGGAEVESLRRLDRAAVSFNYLGQVDEAFADDAPFRPADEPSGPDRAPGGRRPYPIDVLCAVADGRLQVEVTAGGDAKTPVALVERFVEALRWLAEGREARRTVQGPGDGDDLAAFAPEELEALVDRYGGKEP